MKILLRPAPEVAIKGKAVRRQQMKLLRQNVRKLLKRIDPHIVVDGQWDRVDVELPESCKVADQVIDVLQRTPGISSIQEIAVFPMTGFDDVVTRAVEAWASDLEGKSFAVRVRRVGQHDFRSGDLERAIGSALLDAEPTASVDLKSPDVEVRVEINEHQFHVSRGTLKGLGGYPLGAVETVLSLMSGGYDSTVAAYMMLRRGVRSHFVFFNLGGPAHEIGVKQVVHYLWQKYGASHSAKFVSVPFQAVVADIMRNVDSRYWGIVLKRQMLRAASEVAACNNAVGLVTGDAVAQVSSQTLSNLNIVDRACSDVVLRPLVAMDKETIIDTARAIGTEPFARTMPEYCGVISSRPATRARLDQVESEENRLTASVLDEALADIEETPVQALLDSITTPENVELVATPSVSDVIIDVRHPTEEEQNPLRLTSNRVMAIPFYELNERVADLSSENRYLLYCDRGTMSQMHACHLKEEGHSNIQVYAPAAV